VTPTDIEIRRNYLFKPLIWKEGAPGYTPAPSGTPYIVKNNFELKNATRVLFEANVVENCWGGFSQNGFSILLTPKNQSNRCPKCQVTDVTIRSSRIRNVAGVFAIANGLSKEGGATADGGRYSIHDIIADNVHGEDYKGPGVFLKLLSVDPPVHDLQMDHITAFVPGPLLSLMGKKDKIDNFSLTNSVLSIGGRRAGFASAGRAHEDCSSDVQNQGAEAVLKACFSNYKFDNNIIIAERGRWPSGIIVASSPQSAGIRDFKDGVSKDPRLCREKTAGCAKASPGAGAAPGGKDLGADVDAVEEAISGVSSGDFGR
jgi:hypothetical protein